MIGFALLGISCASVDPSATAHDPDEITRDESLLPDGGLENDPVYGGDGLEGNDQLADANEEESGEQFQDMTQRWGDALEGLTDSPLGRETDVVIEEEMDGDVEDVQAIEESDADPWENVSFAEECPDDPGCENTSFVDASAGMFHSCAVTGKGSLMCWGHNKDGQASPPDGQYQRVWAGWEQTCGLLTDGHVLCWGLDSQGQSSPPEDLLFSHVSIGRSHVCGVTLDQGVSCWGENHQGMSSPPDGLFKQAAVGRYYSCALSVSGDVMCFGDDSQGTVSEIPSGPFTDLTSGRWHVCALRGNGEVVCWGSNEFGQLDVPPGPFVQIDGGWTHTCGLRESGIPVCWGENHQGLTPPPEASGEWTWVSAGDGHNCGIRDQKVVCWGSELAGQTFVPGEGVPQDEECDLIDCADGDPCTLDSCLSGNCFHHQILCDDGDPCTGEFGKDFCDPQTGECQYPLWWDCDDGNECTFDLCDGVGGCSHTGHFGFCDDGDSCTLEDQCNDSVCVSGVFNMCDEACIGEPVEDCSDGDPCTMDYCDPAQGCINEVMLNCP